MSDRSGAFAQTVARVRRSVLHVETSRARGSGYVALANGLVVTSHAVAGYEPNVRVSTGDGTMMEAKVVAVDVAADLALILAPAHLGQAALRVPPSLPRLGDTVLVLHHSPSGLVVTPAVIGAVDHHLEQLAHLVVDAAFGDEHLGAPVVDVEGRVVGTVCRPRRDFSSDGSVKMVRAVLSTAAYDGTIHSLSGGRPELETMAPTYSCPGCAAGYSADVDRCLACGAALPHTLEWRSPLTTRRAGPSSSGADNASEPDRMLEPHRLLRGTRTIREFLATLGISSTRVRTGASTWRVLFSGGEDGTGSGSDANEIFLQLDGAGDHVLLRTPVVTLPKTDHEAFLRLLLTLNDDTLGPYRLSMSGSAVFLSRTQPLYALAAVDASSAFGTLVRVALHFRGVLGETFGAEHTSTHEGL